MQSLLNITFNAAAIASKPVLPLIGAGAFGYFLTDLNHQYFEYLRASTKNDSMLRNFVMGGTLNTLEYAVPIAAFICLPLDPFGISIRVGMATRIIFTLAKIDPMKAIKEKMASLLTVLVALKNGAMKLLKAALAGIVNLIKYMFDCAVNYFGKKLIELEPAMVHNEMGKSRLHISTVKTNAEFPLNETNVDVTSQSETVDFAPATGKGSATTAKKPKSKTQPRANVRTTNVSGVNNPFLAIRNVSNDLTKKSAAPVAQAMGATSGAYDDIDGDYRLSEKVVDVQPKQLPAPRFTEIKYPKLPRMPQVNKAPVLNRPVIKPIAPVAPRQAPKTVKVFEFARSGLKLAKKL